MLKTEPEFILLATRTKYTKGAIIVFCLLYDQESGYICWWWEQRTVFCIFS